MSDIYGNTADMAMESPEEIDSSNKLFATILALGLLSVTGSSIVAGTIWFNKKMRGHPNGLICGLAVANIGSCVCTGIYSLGTPKFACYLGFAQLF